MIVCRPDKVTYAWPSTPLRAFFVSPTRHSQYPPYQGARHGINFHSTPFLPNSSCIVLDSNNALKSSAAEIKVEALSDITSFDKDFQLANCLKAYKNVSSDRSVTTSRRTALVLAHVKRHIYMFQ